MDLDGARVLLTGASAGIGAALAPMLAGRGASLWLTGRETDRLDLVAERCRDDGASVRTTSIDLGDPDAAEDLAREVDERFDGVDVLINNAGAPMRRRVQRLRVDELRATMAVNFESPARMAIALLDGMLARDRGVIVNVSSFGGRAGIPAEAAYCASKFALCGWSEAMAIDLWHTGVDVRLIVPGPVDTDIWHRPGNDPAHFAGTLEPPENVARGILAAIEGRTVVDRRFEHHLPDLHGVIDYKCAAIDDYLAGAAAFASGE